MLGNRFDGVRIILVLGLGFGGMSVICMIDSKIIIIKSFIID
jgi:hypothetical protein